MLQLTVPSMTEVKMTDQKTMIAKLTVPKLALQKKKSQLGNFVGIVFYTFLLVDCWATG